MTDTPGPKSDPIRTQASQPQRGGSAGSDSQASTPAPRLSTGEPERFEFGDKPQAAPEQADSKDKEPAHPDVHDNSRSDRGTTSDETETKLDLAPSGGATAG